MSSTLQSIQMVNLCYDPEYEKHSPFCRLLLNMPVITCILKPDGETIFVNRVIYPVTGYQPQELLGKNWWQTFFPGELYHQVEVYLKKVEKGDVTNIDMTIQAKDGSRRTLLCSSTNFYDENGGLEILLRFGVDITHMKKVEAELRESEERFRQLSEVGFEGIVVHDGTRINNANQVFIDLFGYSLEELKKLDTLRGFFTAETWGTVRQHIVSGSEEPYEADGIKKDGTVFPLQIRGKRIQFGEKTYRVAAVVDMSRLKQVEADLRHERDLLSKVTETSPTGIFQMDRDGRFVFANKKAEEVLGATRGELMLRTFNDLNWKTTDCDGKPIPANQLPFRKVQTTEKTGF